MDSVAARSDGNHRKLEVLFTRSPLLGFFGSLKEPGNLQIIPGALIMEMAGIDIGNFSVH